MKKIVIPLLLIIIIFTAQIMVWANDNVQNNTILSTWYIDTDLNQTFYKEDGKIHIEGWKLATEANTKLKVYLDEEEVDNSYISYSRKYDLISIVKGYGTYKENPAPNFDINIPIDNIDIGTHKLKINFTTSDSKVILQSIEKEIKVSRNIKHILNIDTPLENEVFDKKGIQINGWKLATEPDTKLVIKIDGKTAHDTKIDMYYAYDLISIVKGYGTYKENPTPNFTITIPTDIISDGKHKIEIQFTTSDGVLLDKVEGNIIIDKSIKHILNIDTQLSEQSWTPEGITIEGWKLATEPNTKLEVYIENRKIEDLQITYKYIYDLISIVKGYGTYEENPTPNFVIEIPVTEFKDGDNTLTIQMVTEEGKVLEKVTSEILEYKTRIHIETIYDRTSISDEKHSIGGWVMTSIPNTKVRILIDGFYRDEEVTRYDRPDVINAITGYGGTEINPQPGFSMSVDFSKFSLGLHQIAVRVETEEGKIVGEQVIYIFLQHPIIYGQGIYGQSGAKINGVSGGSDLEYLRFGDGPNVFFATFCLHGFEDSWDRDGTVLVDIANNFYNRLVAEQDGELAKNWTIYIFREVNPDGRRLGTTKNGPGRTTLYSKVGRGIDINRSWQTGSTYVMYDKPRNYNGTEGFQAYEAEALRDFLLSHKSQTGKTVLVDLHGWEDQLIGDEEICKYYKQQYTSCRTTGYGRYGTQYLITWARQNLGAKVSLVEMPLANSYAEVNSMGLSDKYVNATLNMLRNEK